MASTAAPAVPSCGACFHLTGDAGRSPSHRHPVPKAVHSFAEALRIARWSVAATCAPPFDRQYHPVSGLVSKRQGLRVWQKHGVQKLGALKERLFDFDLDDAEPDVEVEESFILPEDLARRPPPQGFGQGKVYDTSVEDALMHEIEGSNPGGQKKRQAGDAPVLSKSTEGTTGKRRPPLPPPVEYKGAFPWLLRGTPEDRYPPNTPPGVKVTLGNLPCKKKVGRDLRKALLAVPGLLVIRPLEEGDRDTRDCTCKGKATLIFKDAQYAQGFCTAFQGRPIQFGKIERRITAKLAEKRQQPGSEAPQEEEADTNEEEEEEEVDDVDELIEEGKEQGAEQLQRQRGLEEEGGKEALLGGSTPQVKEEDLQEATVKSKRDTPSAHAAGEPVDKGAETKRVDKMIEKGKEEGAGQLLKQRRIEETGGKDSLLGTDKEEGAIPKRSKEGEDGRSSDLSGGVEAGKGGSEQKGTAEKGAAKAGLKLAQAVRLQEASDERKEGKVDIDDLFDEEDLMDEALDKDEEDWEDEWDAEGEEGEDEWEEDEEEVEVSDFEPGADTSPRSASATLLLDDGTLVVKGREVGRIDPSAAKDGQLHVPADVAARIGELTGGQPIEIEVETKEALQQKRAFEEKLVAWHFGQLPGFEGSDQPSKEDVTVTWDRANRTMVRGGGFDKAKHKRLKKLAREPVGSVEGAQEKGGEGKQEERADKSEGGEEDFESDDEFEEEEWILDESDDEGEDEAGKTTGARSTSAGKAGASSSVSMKLGKVDPLELLAAEKREMEASIERLRAAGKPVPEPSPEVLELISKLKANPNLFDDEEDEEGSVKSTNRKTRRRVRAPRSEGQSRAGGQQSKASKRGSTDGTSSGKEPKSKRSSKPRYDKLLSDLQKGI